MITQRCGRSQNISSVPSQESSKISDKFSDQNREVTQAFKSLYTTQLIDSNPEIDLNVEEVSTGQFGQQDKILN